MSPDVHTLAVVQSLILLSLGWLLAFYRAYLKTYPGFGHWIIGTVACGAGLLLQHARAEPPSWLPLAAGGALLASGTALRLDGSLRFLRGVRAPVAAHLVAPLLFLAIPWLVRTHDDLDPSHLLSAIWTAVASLAIARELPRGTNPGGDGLSRAVAAAFAAHGLLALARLPPLLAALAGSLPPAASDRFHALFFFAGILLEFSFTLGFVLLTGERVGGELAAARDRTVAALDRLDALRDDADRLGALLPVCMHCGRMRDDDGLWREASRMLEARSAARFHDSLCPDCLAGEPSVAVGTP